MFSRLGRLLATGLGVMLLIYSATRSLDFISLTLPADKQILAWFGLAALDVGVIAWLMAYLYGSGSAWQRVIAFGMVIIDFLGACAMFTLDTLYNAGNSGLINRLTPDAIQNAVLALSLVIAINIGATLAHHMLDPEAMRRHAEEEARAEIEAQALVLIRENAKSLAAQVAPQIAGSWKEQTALEYGHRIKKAKSLPAQFDDLPAQTSDLPAIESNPTPPPSRKR